MDRDKVIKGLECCVKESEGYIEQCGECPYGANCGCIDRLLADTITLLKEQDKKVEQLNRYINGFSRDAMPVVRCEDCKHWEQSNGHCPFNSIFTNADWYCADGEYKEGR